jgi:hypothetical protein
VSHVLVNEGVNEGVNEREVERVREFESSRERESVCVNEHVSFYLRV